MNFAEAFLKQNNLLRILNAKLLIRYKHNLYIALSLLFTYELGPHLKKFKNSVFQLTQKMSRPDPQQHKNSLMLIKYIKVSLIHQNVNVLICNEKFNFLRYTDICTDQCKDKDQLVSLKNTNFTVQSPSEFHPRHPAALFLLHILLAYFLKYLYIIIPI